MTCSYAPITRVFAPAARSEHELPGIGYHGDMRTLPILVLALLAAACGEKEDDQFGQESQTGESAAGGGAGSGDGGSGDGGSGDGGGDDTGDGDGDGGGDGGDDGGDGGDGGDDTGA